MRHRKDDVKVARLHSPAKDGKTLTSLRWKSDTIPLVAHTDRWASEVIGYLTRLRTAEYPTVPYGSEPATWVIGDIACETDPTGMALSPLVTLDAMGEPGPGQGRVVRLHGTLVTVAVVRRERAPWDGMDIR